MKDLSYHKEDEENNRPLMYPPSYKNLKSVLSFTNLFKGTLHRTKGLVRFWETLRRIGNKGPNPVQSIYWRMDGVTDLLIRTQKLKAKHCISWSFHKCECKTNSIMDCEVFIIMNTSLYILIIFFFCFL